MPVAQLHAYESITRIAREIAAYNKPRLWPGETIDGDLVTINLKSVAMFSQEDDHTIVFIHGTHSVRIRVSYEDFAKAYAE